MCRCNVYVGNGNISGPCLASVEELSICRTRKCVSAEGFTVGAGLSRLYGSSPQAKVACEDLQISLIRRNMSAGVSSCVECWVGSMGPLIWQIL
jgi:hypothetical protein